MVVFLNEPKFSEHAVDQKFNERRKILIPQIEELITNHSYFKDKLTKVTFLHTGVSSLVSILDADEEKYVLKIPLSILDSRQEGRFLKIWKELGIKVPQIFDEGKIGDSYFILMEFIDEVTLVKKYSQHELIEKNIYKEMGSILKRMHHPKFNGFSNIVNDKSDPEYRNISEWLENDTRTKQQIDFVKEHKIINDVDHGSVDEACKFLINHIGNNDESVYCHNDFNVGNIFATNPLTVFDPWPCFHHPYMDLSRAIVTSLLNSSTEMGEQLIEGYKGNGECDRQLLQAFIILNVAVKLKYQFETNNSSGIKNMQDYLTKTKHFFLGS